MRNAARGKQGSLETQDFEGAPRGKEAAGAEETGLGRKLPARRCLDALRMPIR